MNHFSKTQIAPHFEKWEAVKEKIARSYDEKSPEAIRLMEIAIEDYQALLDYGGKAPDKRTGENIEVLLPLNGIERFEFIKARIYSHYAYIQLNELYDETRKKAARLSVMK